MTSLRFLGACAAIATLLLAAATRWRPVQRLDDALERLVGTHRVLMAPFARIGTLPGERFAHPLLGAAGIVTILLTRPGGPAGRVIVPIAAASLGAILAHHAVKFVYRRPRPVAALERGKIEAAFPSGHTTDATAVVLTVAYLLVREGILPATLAVPFALLIALVTGVSRVALGWHWGTDVVGGWLMGIAVASQCGLLYQNWR